MSVNNTTPPKLRIFVDTNVIISALFSAKSICAKLLYLVADHHRLIISDYTIEEIQRVLLRKSLTDRIHIAEFLSAIEYELVKAPHGIEDSTTLIRDPKDLPILLTALFVHPDIFVTGDLDFHTIELKQRLLIMAPGDCLRMLESDWTC